MKQANSCLMDRNTIWITVAVLLGFFFMCKQQKTASSQFYGRRYFNLNFPLLQQPATYYSASNITGSFFSPLQSVSICNHLWSEEKPPPVRLPASTVASRVLLLQGPFVHYFWVTEHYFVLLLCFLNLIHPVPRKEDCPALPPRN